MAIELIVFFKKKKYKVCFEFGWYKGNDFALFNGKILELYGGGFTVVGIQIAKLIFSVDGYRVYP